MRGGYGGDLAALHLDDGVNMVEHYMAAPLTLEHMLHDNVPLAQAFDALFNMLARQHYATCPIQAVEVA